MRAFSGVRFSGCVTCVLGTSAAMTINVRSGRGCVKAWLLPAAAQRYVKSSPVSMWKDSGQTAQEQHIFSLPSQYARFHTAWVKRG